MAHPNLVNVTNIVTGYKRFMTDGDQGTTENLVSNAASSGKLFRIVNFSVSCRDNQAASIFYLRLYEQDDYGGTYENIIESNVAGNKTDADVYGGNMPTTYSFFSTTRPFFLHEDRSFKFAAGQTNKHAGFMCWEEITDA